MVIILWSEGIANVSRLQYLVLVTLLLKAAYAPAAENARVKKERENRTKWRCLEDGYLTVISLLSIMDTHTSYLSFLVRHHIF